jgi:hypothetical protein
MRGRSKRRTGNIFKPAPLKSKYATGGDGREKKTREGMKENGVRDVGEGRGRMG